MARFISIFSGSDNKCTILKDDKMTSNKNEAEQVNKKNIGETVAAKATKINVRKITMSEDIQQKAAMLISKYHSKLLLEGKTKTDELLSIIVTEAIEYLYDNKLIPDINTVDGNEN